VDGSNENVHEREDVARSKRYGTTEAASVGGLIAFIFALHLVDAAKYLWATSRRLTNGDAARVCHCPECDSKVAPGVGPCTFIRCSRELGFSLEISARWDGRRDCAAKKLTLRHLADVGGKIASLKRLERALESMTEACNPGDQNSCPSSTLYRGKIELPQLK